MAGSHEMVRLVRIVAVAPGDVTAERKRLRRVVAELNRGIARTQGCQLLLWNWETDAYPGLHLEGPQGLIDDAMDIEKADVVLGIFWTRFGTPTLGAASGTEHELRRAWASWQQRGRPQVMVYFGERKSRPTSATEAAQLHALLRFREAMPEQQLWWRYATLADFERAVREHLTTFVLAMSPATVSIGHRGQRTRFKLAPPAAYFTGRHAEVEVIARALAVTESTIVVQVITGLGGVGKTQLAARYVQSHADDYGVVAWVRAADGGATDLAALADTLDLAATEMDTEARAAVALRWLERCDERWLLVLDDLAGPEHLEACCPNGGEGRVLITSRNRNFAQMASSLDLDVFDEDTATDYLIARTGRDAERVTALTLSRALGGLPLALAHAGAYCTVTTFEKYLDLLEDLPPATLYDRSPEAFYRQTVASTWQPSIKIAEGEAPGARAVLAMAAHLAPDAIPLALFDVLLEDGGDALQRKQLVDAIRALDRYSLADLHGATVSVHRLLQRVVRESTSNTDLMHRAGRSALAALTAGMPSDPQLPDWWPQYEELLPHVLALSTTLASTDGDASSLVTLLNDASRYLLFRGTFRRALDVSSIAEYHAARLLGADHPRTLRARSQLAWAYWQAGRTEEAIGLEERLLADYERIHGPEHQNTIGARANLAGSYFQAGRIDDAIKIEEQVLVDLERLRGDEDLETLTARANLGVSYRHAGRTTDAIPLLERVLASRERLLGGDHPATLNAAADLAVAFQYAGRITEATLLGERVLVGHERRQGADHPDTVTARANLSCTYQEAGRHFDAIALAERAVADRERLLGEQHPDTLNARGSLAAFYLHAGLTTEATVVQEAVLADTQRLLGAANPHTLRARANLAASYSQGGRVADAIALQEQALADHEHNLGIEHPETLTARSNLAAFYWRAGRNAEAIALKKRVLADSDRRLGSQHPDTLARLDDLQRWTRQQRGS